MIDAKEFIKENMMTEAELARFIGDLRDELSHQKKVKYIQKVDAVRELLKEMSEEYPNWLALEGDGLKVEIDLYWEDLFTLFKNTYHEY